MSTFPLHQGVRCRLGETQGGLNDDIMRVQIKNTIQEHLEKNCGLMSGA